jgi:hypothetical protein
VEILKTVCPGNAERKMLLKFAFGNASLAAVFLLTILSQSGKILLRIALSAIFSMGFTFIAD